MSGWRDKELNYYPFDNGGDESNVIVKEDEFTVEYGGEPCSRWCPEDFYDSYPGDCQSLEGQDLLYSLADALHDTWDNEEERDGEYYAEEEDIEVFCHRFKSLAALARHSWCVVSYTTLCSRLRRGWLIEEAVFVPVGKGREYFWNAILKRNNEEEDV